MRFRRLSSAHGAKEKYWRIRMAVRPAVVVFFEVNGTIP